MKEILNDYIKDIKYFLNSKKYMISVIITAILSYGFVITHYSVNIDTLSGDRYFNEGMLIGQGRISAVIIEKIFNIMNFNPFLTDSLALIVLILATISFCSLFKKISKNEIKMLSYSIFSCIFISYPLINEIFVYTPASLSIAIGFLMIYMTLNFINYYFENSNFKYIIYSTLSLFFAISLYESFMSVYLCGILIVIILKYLYKDDTLFYKSRNKLFVCLLPALVSLVLYLIVPKVIMILFNIKENFNAEKGITYFSGLKLGLSYLKNSIIRSYLINGMFYLPITVLIISEVTAIILGIVFSIKKKNIMYTVMFLALIFSLFLMSVLQGKASPYRTCQYFTLFCSFIFMLFSNLIITSKVKNVFKIIIICSIYILVFYQVKYLHNIFYLNYVRYDNEKDTLTSICNEIINNYDIDKPVIFVGNYECSEYIKEKTYIKKDDYRMKIAKKIVNIFNGNEEIFDEDYKYIETNVNSYLTWGINAFNEPNTEIFKWIYILGYDLKQGNSQMYNEAVNYIKENVHTINKNAEIFEMENYIIVNL